MTNIYYILFFFLIIRRPPISTLFPYTTLFRSIQIMSYLVSPVASTNNKLSYAKFLKISYLPFNYGRIVYWNQGFREIIGDRSDRKSTRLNSSHANISYAVFCLKKKTKKYKQNM